MKTRYCKRTHKFGIIFPVSGLQALETDKNNGNTLWKNTTEKKIRNIMTDFQFLEDDKNVPIGYQNIKLHMVFDVQTDFKRKAQLVARLPIAEMPASLTYPSVVSNDSVRIELIFATLNELDVLAWEIVNIYLNAPCREKMWNTYGPEFGDRKV